MNRNDEQDRSVDTDTGAKPSRLRDRKLTAFALRVGMLVTMVVLSDVLVGVTLCRNSTFMRWRLPPYSLVFTKDQAKSLKGMVTNESDYGMFDPDLGWSIRPNGALPERQFQANSAGFRADREYSLDPPAGITRIAAFGESYTHCSEVAYGDSWTHRLEQSRPELEVLNFGVGGYGTDQAYLRYQRDGLPYQPRIVLIGFMLENILRNVSVYRPAYSHLAPNLGVKPRFRMTPTGELELIPCPAQSTQELKALIESRALVETLTETDYWVQRAPTAYEGSWVFASSFVRIAYSGYENLGRRSADYYDDPDGEPFNVTLTILTNFYASALEDGAERAFVLVFPERVAMQHRLAGKPAYWTPLTDALRKSGIPVIDLTPPLMAWADQHDGDIEAVFNGGGHYGRDANAVVARTVSAALFPQDGSDP